MPLQYQCPVDESHWGGEDPVEHLERTEKRIHNLSGVARHGITSSAVDLAYEERVVHATKKMVNYLEKNGGQKSTKDINAELKLPWYLISLAVEFSEQTKGRLYFSRDPKGRKFYTREGIFEGYSIVNFK